MSSWSMTAFDGPSVANSQVSEILGREVTAEEDILTVYLHEFLTSRLLFLVGILVIVDVVACIGAMLGFFL